MRLRWDAFAQSAGLRSLPPVGAAIVAVVLGVLLPFAPRVDALPPQLSPSLADARIGRFLRTHPEIPDTGPAGTIYAARPAFHWPEREGAESYAFRLERADGTAQAAAEGITRTFHFVPPPGRLEPGAYRFEVLAVVKGAKVHWQERSFSVVRAPEDLERLVDTVSMELDAAASAHVLMGCYADLQSPHDVVSAFLQWKAASGEADSLGKGPAAAWIKTLR
jgi:hypothetical protein